jgi:UDP-N-acetylmuramate--alanine ligase
MDSLLQKAKTVHFIGIGGIGISAVARMLKLEGKIVSGSDRGESEVTHELQKQGIIVHMGQKVENIPADCDLVIYTVAIPQDNPEFIEAKKRNIPLLSYPQTLASISKEKYTIAVSGTHGKTTVTAMTAGILIEAGFKPTVLVGSLMRDPRDPKNQGTNFIPGSSKYFIVEADEYRKSFHNLYPTILVINNIDEDHLDFYKGLADIQNSFRELAERVPKDGYVICNVQDPHVAPVVAGLKCKVIDYTQHSEKNFSLQVPGEHNRSNAAAAFSVGKALGVSETKSLAALQKFTGTWRRFEYKGTTKKGAKVYDDYAHNPKKVFAAIQGTREAFPDKKLIAVFQPHLYSRTKDFLKEFAEALKTADEVLLAPIYAAREEHDPSISSEILAKEIVQSDGQAQAYSNLEEIEKMLVESATDDHIILVMGAGDITDLAKRLAVRA